MKCTCTGFQIQYDGCSCGAKAAKVAEIERALRIAATWDAWDAKFVSQGYLEMWEMCDIIDDLKDAAAGEKK